MILRGPETPWSFVRSVFESADPAAVRKIETFIQGHSEGTWHDRVGQQLARPMHHLERAMPAMRLTTGIRRRVAAEVVATAAQSALASGCFSSHRQFKERVIRAFSSMRKSDHVVSDIVDRYLRVQRERDRRRQPEWRFMLDSSFMHTGRPLTIAYSIGSLDTAVSVELQATRDAMLAPVGMSMTGAGLADSVCRGHIDPELLVLSREGAMRVLRQGLYEPIFLMGDVHHSLLRMRYPVREVGPERCHIHGFCADLSTNQAVYAALADLRRVRPDAELEHIEGDQRRAILRAGQSDLMVLVTEPDGLIMRLEGIATEVEGDSTMTTPSLVLARRDCGADRQVFIDKALASLLDARAELAADPMLLIELCEETQLADLALRSPACKRSDSIVSRGAPM